MPTPSTYVIFYHSGSGVTCRVPGPSSQTEIAPSARFVTDLSANHTRWTYQLTTAQKFLWSTSAYNLKEAERADLQGFFERIAKGPTNQFTYTHTDGVSWTARFVDTVLKWTRVNGTEWGTTFTLEFESDTWTTTPTTTTAPPTTTSTTTTTTAAP